MIADFLHCHAGFWSHGAPPARTSDSPYLFANALRPNLAKLAESDLHLISRNATGERARFKICNFLSERVERFVWQIDFFHGSTPKCRAVIARAY